MDWVPGVEDLEQRSRADRLVITGLETKHQSYARAASPAADQQGDAAPSEEMHTLENKWFSDRLVKTFTWRVTKSQPATVIHLRITKLILQLWSSVYIESTR